MKIFSLVVLVIAILLFSVGYNFHSNQRQRYADSIATRLEIACTQLIENDFGKHATPFDDSETHNRPANLSYWEFGIKRHFTRSNDLLFLDVYGRSTLYFSDHAPQEITCRATLPFEKRKKITKNTEIEFKINGIRYLPNNFQSSLAKNPCFKLTMKEIEDIAPYTSFIHLSLEKPKFL